MKLQQQPEISATPVVEQSRAVEGAPLCRSRSTEKESCCNTNRYNEEVTRSLEVKTRTIQGIELLLTKSNQKETVITQMVAAQSQEKTNTVTWIP